MDTATQLILPYIGEHDDQPLPEKSLADKVIDLMTGLVRWKSEIDAALETAKNSHGFDDIVTLVMQGRCQFFEFDDCFIIMQIDVFPHYKSYHCFLAGGDMKAIMAAQEKMRQNAEALGCKYMSISGRPGWARQLKKAGWDHLYSTLYCEV